MKKNKQKLVVIFEEQNIRRLWDAKAEKWYFSVVDIIRILTQSADARNYWKVLKSRLNQEGSQLVTFCNQLKMLASDGKSYLTDVLDIEGIFRLVQSVPSPKAEPLKLWLAKVGYERMQETVDPELSMKRGRENWQTMGRSKKWIEQRMMSVETRNKLTDYWSESGVKEGVEFAKLTDLIHKEWSGLSITGHKKLKNLQTQNLRDHMSEAELIFTALAELSTRQIAETDKAVGYDENKQAAKKGGEIAGDARRKLEVRTGKKVVTNDNYLPPAKIDKKIDSKKRK